MRISSALKILTGQEPRRPALVCAIGGDHLAIGSIVSTMSIPAGYWQGYEMFFNLAFCDQHSSTDDYAPGQQFHGVMQIGYSEADVSIYCPHGCLVTTGQTVSVHCATHDCPETKHTHRFDGADRCMGCRVHWDDLPAEEQT